jgi:hypothetical protein
MVCCPLLGAKGKRFLDVPVHARMNWQFDIGFSQLLPRFIECEKLGSWLINSPFSR